MADKVIYRAVVVIYSTQPIDADFSPEQLCKRGAADAGYIAYWPQDPQEVSESQHPDPILDAYIRETDYLALEYFEQEEKQ